jgi:hypothetical protein
MAAAAFGIFDHVDRSDEPLGALYEHRRQLVEAAEASVDAVRAAARPGAGAPACEASVK